MKKVSNEIYYDSFIERDSREFKLYCTIADEVISESDISSINIDYDLMSGSEEYTIGNLAPAKLTMVVSNNIGDIYETNDIELTVSLKTIDLQGLEVWIPVVVGRFYVFDISYTKLSRTITAYDDLYKIQLERTYESTLTYPTTVHEILDEICPLLDVYYDDDDVPDETINKPEVVTETVLNKDNGRYEVVVSESNQVCLGMKVGQVLMCIASYLNGNFIVGGGGHLKLIKYPTEVTKTLNANKYAPPTIGLASYSMGKIDCTTYANNVISVGYDEDSSSMQLENPFMDRTRLLAMLDYLSEINYRQARVKIKGDPRLELGDLIEIINTDSNGNFISTQKIPILRMTFRYTGGCTNEIESPCKALAEKTIDYKGTISSRIDTLENSVQTISKGLYDSVSKLKTVKEYVDDMYAFVEKQGIKNATGTITESESKQYDAIVEKIESSNNIFNSEYDEIYNNKYLK